MILLALLVLLSILGFYLILQADLSGIAKFLLIVIEMILVSQVFIRKYKVPNEMGLILIKSQRGIDAINNLAKKDKIWNFFSDMSSTISYGLLSMVLMKKNTSLKSVALGLIFLFVISSLIAPMAMEFLKTVLSGSSVLEKETVFTADAQIVALVMFAILVIGGFFGALLTSILYYGLYILSQVIDWLIYGTDAIASTAPGGTLLLPGVNLPFFEGILALIVIMMVHEGSHAVLARIAKVPIKSSGIVLFGIIPIGAFVEPDEKQLEKVDRIRQTRVLAAGSGANFITSVAFFIIFVGLALLLKEGYAGDAGLLYSAVRFLYITTGLAFALNFIVATVNLLPLPLFDGYRIIDINVQNKQLVKTIMLITLGAFFLNFLPWLFSG